MRCERGQASVEWIGLVLLVAVALGGLVAVVPEVEGRSLGALVADRILPGRGGGGAATVAGPDRAGSLSGPPTAPRLEPRRFPPRLGPRRTSPEPRRAALRRPALRLPAIRLDGVRRIAGAVTKRAWIACLGYKRYRYEREHPARLAPFDRMPLRDAARIADDCLNPFGFLREQPRP